ncbi:DUF1674 domain-containing protein [Afifella marina]|uniref:DUF1674 domain-containing protein n=1 Tax=Afifella marina DSM 2698 TaxID=1120955 RepID=A0A1G5NNL6_AFIMA|nr:DUF1674 domain-containing protein [Afifella marina]MBK1624573.1 DUF1674 domain-containing protein [Afifella marina DSM 2698]MBK1627466.1 DUF1674 domain-containing protein [Afifella marina]MBK5918524.1 hypothetical protein [Afifella marina]RAI18574.1 hypothetical protein CH311_15400 [Afifella marina DSM 2698]SCZ39006.1 hypothetical protein SAMN03080610_02376 [Afifella marina DSM 2698]
MNEASNKSSEEGIQAETAAPRRELPEAAKRALAEAEERRRQEAEARAAAEAARAKELNGAEGPEPVRFGDWERKGRAIDF